MHTNPIANGLLSGAVAAVLAALLHLIFLQPILLRAEDYESGVRAHSIVAADDHHGSVGDEIAEAVPNDKAVPTRFDTPFDLVRDSQTVGFFLLTYVGFGMLLAVAVDLARLRGYSVAPGHFVVWGAAGFAAFALVPSFGLPPEPPGLAAGTLVLRQAWWIASAAITVATLAAIAFAQAKLLWGAVGALSLSALMFMVPEPGVLTGTVPPELSGIFAARAMGVAAAAWLVLSLCVLRDRSVASKPVVVH